MNLPHARKLLTTLRDRISRRAQPCLSWTCKTITSRRGREPQTARNTSFPFSKPG
jgi:hypothetical protein